MKRISYVLAVLAILSVIGFSVANSKFFSVAASTPGPNPVPLVSQPLVPDAVAPGGAGFPLTVNGTGFVSGSIVNWNGNPRTTNFVSDLQLTATILASDIATATTASITVVNPSPGGGTSNVVFFPITLPTSSITLSRSAFGTGSGPTSVVTGDFNADGKLDLAVANDAGNTVSILLGNGDGTFQAHVDYGTGIEPGGVAVGDFNGDGSLDLAVANRNFHAGNTVSVLLGNGDGTFQPHVDHGTGSFPVCVAVGDFNGDGSLDLAVANYGPDYATSTVSILLGNGDGTFQTHVDYAAGVNPNGVLVGDFNRDNKIDLAVLDNNGSQGFSVLLGNGDGSFQKAVNYAELGNPRVGLVADLNSDGNPDLAIANYYDNSLSIRLGNGDGTFQAHVNYPAGTNPNAAAGGDLNGDGKLDFVTANYGSNDVSVLRGNGDGTFQPHVDYAAGSGPGSVVVGDFNGDGRLDLAVSNQTDDTVSVLLQNPVVSTKFVCNGSARLVASQTENDLRLTATGIGYQTGSCWYNSQQSIENGFTTIFTFQITQPSPIPADGFAFVIQNSIAGLQALGGTGFGLGYGPGDVMSGNPIENSIAVEFDTYRNSWDPNANHVAVQSCGTQPNTSDHSITACSFGITPNPHVTLSDGNVHLVKITFAADTEERTVYVDKRAVLRTTLSGLSLNLNNGGAWVGFTGATGAATENHDILSWSFKSGPPIE